MNIFANDKATQRVVTILSFAAFASSATVRICDPLLPIIAETFGVTTGQAASVITATNVGYGISLLAVGPLGDHLGKFRAITFACFACFVCALAAMGSALSVSLGWLIVTRVITGAVTAALIPLSMAWIGDVVQIEERQNTLAKFMTGQIIGLVTGQAIGGYFADTLGWQILDLDVFSRNN
jgi:YNFM family putative membrane transporter